MGAGYAAIIIKREKNLAAHFRDQRATSASTAQSLEVLRVEHNNIFRRLEDRAVIRQGPGGTYYLDELSWDAMRRTRQRILAIVLLVSVLLLGYIFATAKDRIVPKDQPTTQSNL